MPENSYYYSVFWTYWLPNSYFLSLHICIYWRLTLNWMILSALGCALGTKSTWLCTVELWVEYISMWSVWTPVGSSRGGVENIITTLPHDMCAARPSSYKLSSSDRATASLWTRDPVHTTVFLGQTSVSSVSAALTSWAVLPDWARFRTQSGLIWQQWSRARYWTDLVKVSLLPGPGKETRQVHSEPVASYKDISVKSVSKEAASNLKST